MYKEPPPPANDDIWHAPTDEERAELGEAIMAEIRRDWPDYPNPPPIIIRPEEIPF